ncbi:hypothetical protein EN851_25030 [Mesorhizobium sp. M8A.F.Ca.ET.208.01.1.1]|uniref:DUF6575 domain-containing protein n=1 Tax=unclassified Mesorhizobium TaxID=325217 RepID=UPI0010935BFB|nr:MULTISPECIES: DUF6575 domain-containing protein [unclassified Mesorhizobium]TGQ88812.1 hypothetical protein EN851_25030 [Mesorhizobium sp. M8A.F.Ca.ET.208.01.1.1]TGT50099.1 hypothetical protein EN810_24930 [Mesorhizobium sp. M8A.F.Ca.ET.167.01.1.1]
MLPPPSSPLGPLKLDKVFIEYDSPQLFTCKDATGSHFLAVHAFEDERSDQWIYVRLSTRRLRQLKQGHLDLYDAFRKAESGHIDIVYFKNGFFDRIETTRSDKIQNEIMPERHTFLTSIIKPIQKVDSASNYATLSNESYEFEDLDAGRVLAIASESAPMWEISPVVIDYLKRMRTPVHVAAERSHRVVADIVLKQAESAANVPLAALGALLATTQRLVDALGQPPSGGMRGPIGSALAQWTKLDAVAPFPSSFGIRIETRETSMFGDTGGQRAVELMVSLIAIRDESVLRAALENVHKRALLHYKMFVKAVAKTGSDLNFSAGVPGTPSILEASMRANEAEAVYQWLDSVVQKDDADITFEGRLVGVSLKSRTFLLENEKESYEGRIAEECLKEVDQKRVNMMHVAIIGVRTELNEATGEEYQRYTLKKISALDDEQPQ